MVEKIEHQAKTESTDKEYRKFVWGRIIATILITIVFLWTAGYVAKRLMPASPPETAPSYKTSDQKRPETQSTDATHEKTAPADAPAETDQKADKAASADTHEKTATGGKDGGAAKQQQGVAFVEALIAPLEYELKQRFWGWRPNDIINITDNVDEMQLGVLEVTRRTTVALNERIARRGMAESLNPDLEQAMNWLMVNADNYWFPAPENKYREAISLLKKYKQNLQNDKAGFYTRTDNLIPLLHSLAELLGSCDDNLVKRKEKDGEPVSTFHADNYFYYSKGVAKAMHRILQAVETDFHRTLEVRGGTDVLHHAIEACHHAAKLDPWLCVTEGNPNGILANHRANMAAPISHARFYMALLIETLST
ncbi:MAG: DUF2333 family protein [Thermodesulfobacteriota bacterium]